MVESKHKSHIDKLNSIIEELQQTLLDKEHEWTMKAGLDVRQQVKLNRFVCCDIIYVTNSASILNFEAYN